MNGFFITGTDTEVGKTWVSAALIKGLAQQDFHIIARKPVASGCVWQQNQLVSEDAQMLHQALAQSGQTPPPMQHICHYLFEPPISPARAIRQSTDPQLNRLRLGDLQQACLSNIPDADNRPTSRLVVEGAGGFLSPLAPDGLNADLAQMLGLPIILVVGNRLGCLNHALLSLTAIAHRNLALHAILLNDTQPQADPDNLADLTELVKHHSPFPDTPIYHQAYQSQKNAIAPLIIAA
ncbi:dethiobiotin synthase [Thiomicrospira sp. ALE5]|uniref:dethiobiotin synthase n=1 Tax=Thiomicrospira sp. ALE5 TaxID=748650 RepID=UPI0008EBF9CF|nr:dethiobiotin synthase [Thiomicrospira sp. ALE5]SFR64282.1 dethiobiotin synthetase [Thiomicrospira sp. ALE5]